MVARLARHFVATLPAPETKENTMPEFKLFATVIDETGLKFTRYYNRDSRMWTRFRDDCQGYAEMRVASSQLTRLYNGHLRGKRAMCQPCETLFQWGVVS